MSTFYAAFPDSTKAQLMARHLLNDGIELDDISLVTRDTNNLDTDTPPSTGDASFFVGRSDDPTHDLPDQYDQDAVMQADEFMREMPGLSTSDTSRDVESIDQMDDSQSVAEDLTWPLEDPAEQGRDPEPVYRTHPTDFPAPPTTLDAAFAGSTELDRSLEPVPVPGVGLVMGGGDLATAAFDWVGKNGQPDQTAFLTYLQDEGVPPGAANQLLTDFCNGGAVLAVALLPEVDEKALEMVAKEYGADATGWFGAPRY